MGSLFSDGPRTEALLSRRAEPASCGAVTRCAAATSDGFLVDQHFGRAKSFDVYDIDERGQCRFVETRKVQRACKGELGHSEEALLATARRLSDCAFIVVAKIGAGALAALHEQGTEAYSLVAETEAALDKVWAYRQAQALVDSFEEE